MAKWSVSIDAIASKAIEKVESVVQDGSYLMFFEIATGSPVDTGLFRGNWRCSQGSYSGDTYDTLDRQAENAVAEAGKANEFKVGGVVYYVNNIEYGLGLEYGNSRQAPMGMVRITAASFDYFLKKAISINT